VSGDTEDYPSDKVQDMAQRIVSEVAASVWSVQEEKEADNSTLLQHRRRRRCDRMMVVVELKARSERSVAMLHFRYAQIMNRVESLIFSETTLPPSFGQIAIFVLSNRDDGLSGISRAVSRGQ